MVYFELYNLGRKKSNYDMSDKNKVIYFQKY